MSEISAATIPNQYIVVFKQHTPEDVCQQHREWAQSAHIEAAALRAESDGPELTGVGEQFSFETLNGYVGSFDESLKNEIEARQEASLVDYVEPDYVVYASTETQNPIPSWGLARISSDVKLPAPLPPVLSYTYDSSAGAGTWAYIIDTGILTTHADFGGRATWGITIPAVTPPSNTDKVGHGTHVAGTVGGTKYGIAKKCNLIAVKVLGDTGSGATSSVIQGILWAVTDARNHGRLSKSVSLSLTCKNVCGADIGGKVANLSLGGSYSQALNTAVAAAVHAGLCIVVAAGNNNEDARHFSPAAEPCAYTVGSIDPTDTKSDFSNWGKRVDVFAPGRNITSAWIQSNIGSNTISGTSMAAPHVTGLALTLIAKDPASYSNPASITAGITFLATNNTGLLPVVPARTTRLIAYNGL